MKKRFIRPASIVVTGFVVALLIAAVTFTGQAKGKENTITAAMVLQSTPVPQNNEDRSEVGSTDNILVMSGVITVIILIPVLFSYKSWKREPNN